MKTVLQQRIAWALLAAILLVGAWLRLNAPATSPPGMNVDEALNAWNTYCLLKTGMDQHGVHFPIFRTRGFGHADNRSTLFLYFAIPFLALRGDMIEGIRMAGAFAGLLALLTTCYTASRIFGRPTGLAAMALMAVSPWAVQTTRWGHESSLCPLLVTGAMAALLWAGFPLGGAEGNPRVPRAIVAGLVCGLCCYGYQSVRLFLPVFLACAVWINWRAWLKCDKKALAAMLLGAALLFVPLVWKHLTDPEMNGRGATTWVWDASDPTTVKIDKVLARYPPHFGPRFLFSEGDAFPWLSPPQGYGEFLLYMAPLLIAGAWFAIVRSKTSPAARLLCVWVVLYPIGDLVNAHPGPHSLRSLAGLPALTLLAAWGAVEMVVAIQRTSQVAGWILAGLFVCGSGAMTIAFFHDYFGVFNQEPRVIQGYNVDLVEAFGWLRPQLPEIEAVYCTSLGVPHPYMQALIGSGYEPENWFRDPKVKVTGPMPNGNHPNEETYTRVGKFHFLFGTSVDDEIKAYMSNGKPDRVVFIVRPGELPVEPGTRPAAQFLDAEGKLSLEVYIFTL